MAIVPKRYSEGLFNVAIEIGKVDEFEEQLEILVNDILNDEFFQVVNYPGYNASKKMHILHEVTKDHIDKYLIKFLEVLLQNERINSIKPIAKAYKDLANSYRNTHVVEVTTAFELEDEQINKIKKKMKKLFDADNIEIKMIINPEVIGGIMIKKGDTLIDGTISTKLENIKSAIMRNNL